MPRIRCLYLDCIFLDDNFCTAPVVEIDPDLGCATHAPMGGDLLGEKWEEDETLEDWDTEDIDLNTDDDENNDSWLDEI